MRHLSVSVGGYLRLHAIAFLALFVALGGTAYAIGANTIGAIELKSLVIRQSEKVTVPAGGTQVRFMSCRSNQQFMSGAAGWEGANFGDNTPIVHSQFIGGTGHNPTGFLAWGRNNGGSPRRLFVSVACLRR